MRTRFIGLLLLALLLASPAGAVADTSALSSHFALGVSASPNDTWMPQTGIPWDYTYQYLAGGVNTGSGWRTWRTNSASGWCSTPG